MRLRSAFAFAAPSLGLFVAACSGERREHVGPAFAVPLATAGAPAASASAAPPEGEKLAPLDLETFAPILASPELRGAAELVEDQEFSRAAREVETAIARSRSLPKDGPALRFLLGRLRESAGDFAGALSAYESAASPGWPLSPYAAAASGRMLVRLGKAEDARVRLESIAVDGPLASEVRLLRADAAKLAADRPLEERLLREHLAQAPGDAVPSLRLAELLSSGPAPADRAAEALGLARRAMSKALVEPALVDWAKRVEAQSLQALPPEERAARSRPSAEEELARVEALVDAKANEEAKAAAEALLAAIGRDPARQELACKAELARGRALAGARQWGPASERLADAAGRCKEPDVRARQLFLAGKYADADKRHAQAIRHYEVLEKDLPSHRLADDARLRAAHSYSELGAESRFTDLLSRMADDYPGGDMVLDGMFQLALHRIKKSDWSGAAHVLERAAKEAAAQDAKRGTEFAGRERYYRARAWGVLGDTKKSLDELEAIVRELPLSYYMLHAYSRLARADGARAARALSESLENAASAPFAFERRPEFDSPGFPRALELLRVGDVERAARELDALGLVKADSAPPLLWAIALLYERAGASKLSNGVARGLLTDWLGRWPAGDWKRAWELAFPRPYRQIVARESAKAKVPEHLIYAVMREESSFDPAAESPAKAYGLMQVIEPTARPYGTALGVRIDPTTLKRPSISIAVGSRVLAQLTRTFSDNPLLAIPGYNAGPRPPRRWAEEHPAIDFDVWVELIPYLETRRYTKRVLASRAAYAFLYSSAGADESVKLPVEFAARQE